MPKTAQCLLDTYLLCYETIDSLILNYFTEGLLKIYNENNTNFRYALRYLQISEIVEDAIYELKHEVAWLIYESFFIAK